jgi:hypothetical protein
MSKFWCIQVIEARRGQSYRIVIRNRIFERIGIVTAVDGRNIGTFKVSNEETIGFESMKG